MSIPATTDTDTSPRIISQVKFFNDQKGYGFLSPLTSKGVDRISAPDAADIFVHIGQIKPLVCDVPTLYTGEYVEHGISHDDSGRAQAIAVTGLSGGSLLCDHGVVSFRSYFKRQFQNPRGKRGAPSTNGGGVSFDMPTTPVPLMETTSAFSPGYNHMGTDLGSLTHGC